MDQFCIERGTLLDNSRVRTLEGPDQHSMHCLLDVSLCVNSGFTVLADPEQDGDEYTVAAKFDDAGNALVFDFAAERGRRGSCNDCTGELGEITQGIRAAVVGVVESVGNPSSSDPLARAPSIRVTDVMESSDGCASFTCSVDAVDLAPEPIIDTVTTPPAPTASPTARPTSATVDCNEFQSSVVLNDSPRVTLDFVVNVPGSESNYEFSSTEEAAGGILTAQITYEGEGYVSLASSLDGLMPNSEAVICLPDEDETSAVAKYFMAERSQALVTPYDATQQTLLDTEVTQEGGVTTCRYTKLLNEDDEIAINANGSNTFVWAIGGMNMLSYHRARGSVSIPFEQCTPQGVSEAMVVNQGGAYASYWKAHGILMGLAWGFFAPVAIVAAVCRRLIPGEGVWFQVHRAMNTLCCLFTIAGFSLAVVAYNGTGIPHFNGTHQAVGLSIFVIVIFQVVGGALRPHLPKASSKDLSGTRPTEHNGSDEEQAKLSDEEETSKPQKTTVRFAWEVGHRLAGLALLGMGLYNGYSGLKLYAMRTGNASDYTNVWWGWLGTILGLALVYSMYDRFVSNKSK